MWKYQQIINSHTGGVIYHHKQVVIHCFHPIIVYAWVWRPLFSHLTETRLGVALLPCQPQWSNWNHYYKLINIYLIADFLENARFLLIVSVWYNLTPPPDTRFIIYAYFDKDTIIFTYKHQVQVHHVQQVNRGAKLILFLSFVLEYLWLLFIVSVCYHMIQILSFVTSLSKIP